MKTSLYLFLCSLLVMQVAQAQPVAQCQNTVVALGATGLAQVSATAIDGGSTGATQYAINGAAATTYTCNQIGNNVATLTVTDAQGASASCSAIVTVIDNTAPVVLCASNVNLYLQATGTAVLHGYQLMASASDNCGIAGYRVNGQDSLVFNASHIGIQAVTLTAMDLLGNTASCAAAVQVLDTLPQPCTSPDTTKPVVLCQNISLSLPSTGILTITPNLVDAGTTDNCSIQNLTINNQTVLTFTCAQLGNNTVVLKATDASGNYQTCVSTVTVTDNIAPALVCSNKTIYLDASGIAMITPTSIATATDLCPVPTWQINNQNQLLVHCGQMGALPITITAADASGNSSSCQAILNIVDTVAPVAVCTTRTLYLDAIGNAYLSAAQVNLSSTDNCFLDSIWISQSVLDCSNLGQSFVTLFARDESGNIGSCQSAVTVLDTIAPLAQCQPLTVYLDAAGVANLPPVQLTTGNVDNCSIANVLADSQSSLHFSCVDLGVRPLVVTVWDLSGNVGMCTSDVTILDTFQFCPVLLHLHSADPVYCDTQACVGVAEVVALGGVAPYSFFWSDGGTGAIRTDLCVGFHSVWVIDAVQDTALLDSVAIGYLQGCVWPGDTDDNAVVNNMDMLPIALAFGDIGLPRPNATTNWQGQAAPDWNTALAGLPDHKHLDADGDGMVGQSDVAVVAANYGSEYLRNAAQMLPGSIPLVVDSLTADEGTRIGLPVHLGTAAQLADSVYAIAFTLQYDPSLVVFNSAGMDFSDSWLGSDLLELTHEHSAQGRLDIMVGRKDRMPISGYGQLGTFYITIIEDVLRSSDSIVCMPVIVSDLRLIDHRNTTLGTTNYDGEICIRTTTTGVSAIAASDWQLYPNPAAQICSIKGSEIIESIELYDALGRLVRRYSGIQQREYALDLQDLPDGHYGLSVQTAQGVQQMRLEKRG